MVYNRYIDNILNNKIFSKIDFLKKTLNYKNILFFVITFLVSTQSFLGEIYPFTYIMIALSVLFNVPLILVLGSAILSVAVSTMAPIYLIKIFITFIVFSLITVSINIEGLSKRYAILLKLVISTFLAEMILVLFNGVDFNIMNIMYELLLISSFYLIFTYGMYVLLNINKGFIHSTEETLAMLVVVVLTFSVLKNISIFSISPFNILGIALILIYGWKNGMFYGATAGLIIGLVLSTTNEISSTYILTLAFSGFCAGFFNRFGKTGVVAGCVIGSLFISYWLNGFSEFSVKSLELIIASGIMFIIPKRISNKLDNIFNINNALNPAYENVLDYGSEVKNRLNAVSEVFDNLSKITIPITVEDSKETKQVIRKYILEYTDNNCIGCKQRKNCVDNEKIDFMVESITDSLENNKKIDTKLFEFDCENSQDIIDNLKEIYNSMKLMRIIKQRENANSMKLSKQYKEVSKIINNIANTVEKPTKSVEKKYKNLKSELKIRGYNVYEDDMKNENSSIEYTFITDILTDIDKQKKEIIEIISEVLNETMVIKLILNSSKTYKSKIKVVSKPKYELDTSIISYKKTGQDISGDSYISMELTDGNKLIALSDGVGSGNLAARSSQAVIQMLEKLLNGGFSRQKSIQIINNVMKMKSDDGLFATLDASVINLKTGELEFIKLGAAPTYIVQDKKITVINTCNIPMGIIDDNQYVPIVKGLNKNDVIIQITDGVVTDTMDVLNNYFTEAINLLDLSKPSKELIDDLYNNILTYYNNILKDDITIVVSKIR